MHTSKSAPDRPTPAQQRDQFVHQETAFHLGCLPTEQSHPKTRTLSRTIAQDTRAGIRMLLSVDEDIVPVAAQVFDGPSFDRLVQSIEASLRNGGRVFFSGCGATGRLSILLDAAWRRFWQEFAATGGAAAAGLDAADLENRTVSVMTGGDRALIRSVENFEDFLSFGRRQMREKGVSARDTVIAISEGGETSSVIGTAWEAVDVGAAVFFVFNNPAAMLAARIERSARLIEHPEVTVLDLASGPMAIAGSTRMQATTSELLAVGAALEVALRRILAATLSETDLAALGLPSAPPREYAGRFERLLRQLSGEPQIAALAEWTEYEQALYERGGLATYLADDYLLDILTDTTERAPTFMLPPFRKGDDRVSARSWSFVKNPLCGTEEAWCRTLRRPPAGLQWTGAIYREMGAHARIVQNPPALDNAEIHRFRIGQEDDPSRYDAPASAALLVRVGEEARTGLPASDAFLHAALRLAEPFQERVLVAVGPTVPRTTADRSFHIACDLPRSPLHLWDHLAVKLVLNTVSTATMARMGRVRDNWMVCAEATNKKLIDRGTRLIQHFTGLDYDAACLALYETLADLADRPADGRPPLPPAALAIERITGATG